MVVADPSTSACDVVFVVEGTANLHAYFEYMKNSYIIPTLEYFNGGAVFKYGDFGSKTGGNTFYSLVVYNTADCAPNQSCICTEPTTKAWKVLDSFDNIEFISGAGEKFSLVSEGLGTALTLFDDMKTKRQMHTNLQEQKHCILICNSPPYPLPCQESFHYNGFTSEQLAAMLGERGIHLSIISPRKLPELQKLYDKACGELQIVPTKDYATDPRHMILLKGYHLAERTPASALETKEIAIVKPTTTSSTAVTMATTTPQPLKPATTVAMVTGSVTGTQSSLKTTTGSPAPAQTVTGSPQPGSKRPAPRPVIGVGSPQPGLFKAPTPGNVQPAQATTATAKKKKVPTATLR